MVVAGSEQTPTWMKSSTARFIALLVCSCVLLLVLLPRPRRTTVWRAEAGVNSSSSGTDVSGSEASGPQDSGNALASGSTGGGTGGSTGGSRDGATCKLAVDKGPLADSCHLISDVCVDQRTAILHGMEYRKSAELGSPGAKALPVLEPPSRLRHFVLVHKDTLGSDYRFELPPMAFRPPSAAEPLPYLAHPVFSTCTVPIVYYSHHMDNYAHMFRDNAARLFGAFNETPWAREHGKLVLMTVHGLPAPQFVTNLVQPVAGLALETWGEFTARLPSFQAPGGKGYLPAAWQQAFGSNQLELSEEAERQQQQEAQLPASYEGGPRRCFKHMYVCMDDLNITRWPLHAYGRHLVEYYRHRIPQDKQPPPAGSQSTLRTLVAATAAATAAKGGSSGSTSGSSGGGSSEGEEAVVNVVFHKRSSPERQVLNSGELLKRCNSWQYASPALGLTVRTKCWEVELPDVFAGIAASQQADIFVGPHGANIANAWLMRPGSSVIELTMFEFEEQTAHMNLAKRNMFDNETEVQFWKVLLCDPTAWTPGLFESKGLGKGGKLQEAWPKYRNLKLRWEALEEALKAVIDTGGDMQQYRERWDKGHWWWLSSANETVYAGRNREQTCKAARKQGLIS